jgi:hypothetical protein
MLTCRTSSVDLQAAALDQGRVTTLIPTQETTQETAQETAQERAWGLVGGVSLSTGVFSG